MISLTWTPDALSAAELTPVSVQIDNGMKTSALRCQLVLAHFVTVALDPIPSGQTLALELLQDPEDRSLLYRRGDGPLMAVETILCGLDEDWAATRENVNLAVIRAHGVPAMRIVCAGSGPNMCRSP